MILCSSDLDRSNLALAIAHSAAGLTLIVTGVPRALQDAAEQDPRLLGRIVLLAGDRDGPEMALRLAEIQAGIYRVVVVDQDLLWSVRLADALLRQMPALVIVDTSSLAVDPILCHLMAEAVIQRVKSLYTAPLYVLSGQIPRPVVRRWTASFDAALDAHGPIIGDRLTIRIWQVTDAKRLTALRSAINMPNETVMIVAPSRSVAIALASVLGGQSLLPLHGGLSPSERDVLLAAYREGRQRLLITTETIAGEEGLPAPTLQVWSHPPRSLEMLTRIAMQGRSQVEANPGTLWVLWSTEDVEVLPDRQRASVPALAQLRRVYTALRSAAVGRAACVDPEALSAELAQDLAGRPTLIETALLVLEHAGYLRRDLNLPRVMNLTFTQPMPVSLADVARIVQPRPGVAQPVEPLGLARALGVPAPLLQRRLLDAERAGYLTYRAIGPLRLYTILDPVDGAASAVATALQELEHVGLQESMMVQQLILSSGCRVQTLEAAFGQPDVPRCGRCDRCRGGETSDLAPGLDTREVALSALSRIPLAVPRSAIRRVIRVALEKARCPMDSTQIDDLIEQLLTSELLIRQAGAFGELYQARSRGGPVERDLGTDSRHPVDADHFRP